jgi:tryptophan synthase alpha chain
MTNFSAESLLVDRKVYKLMEVRETANVAKKPRGRHSFHRAGLAVSSRLGLSMRMESTAPAIPRISDTFNRLRASKRIGFIPFVPAGYPDLATTQAAIRALNASGADVIEVGFPFSDPVADGPTIQEAFAYALARKLKVQEIFDAVRRVRAEVSCPLVAMVSFSIVFRYGVERFIEAARQAGFSGLIIPDLPPPEAQRICDQIRAGGLDTILLVAPTTSSARRKQIAELCSGFIYYLSVSGITGARNELPPDLAQNVLQLKSITDRPVCVGFGISTPQQVEMLSAMADGAIVGSALVKVMKQHQDEGAARIAEAISAFCQQLLISRGSS